MSKKLKTEGLPKFISAAQFAKLHGVSPTAVYNKIESGEIKTEINFGLRKFIDHAEYADIVFEGKARRGKKEEIYYPKETK